MFLGSDAYYRLRDKERNVSVEKSRNILDNPISMYKAINKKCYFLVSYKMMQFLNTSSLSVPVYLSTLIRFKKDYYLYINKT